MFLEAGEGRSWSVEAFAVAHLLDEALLGIVETLWHIDAHIDNQVATTRRGTTIAVDTWQALARDTDLGIRLRARLDGDSLLALDERNLHLATQGGCREVDEQVVDEHIVLTHEIGLLFLLDDNVKIARRTTHLACMTIALHGELHALSHTSWNLDVHYLFGQLHTLAMTVRTTGLDLLASTLTVGADALGLHTAKETVDHLDDTASAFTLRAGLELCAILGTGAMAMRTFAVFLELDVLLHASHNIGQRDLDTDADVRTTLATFTLSTEETAEAATASFATKEAIEDIERIEATTAKAAAHARIVETKLVVTLAFVGIAEHLVGLSTLLEFLLGLFIAGILVGVIFDGELAISTLDFVF